MELEKKIKELEKKIAILDECIMARFTVQSDAINSLIVEINDLKNKSKET